MMSSMLFVCGHRKGGTTMLVNILDGHRDLAVLPHDVKILYAYYPRFLDERVTAAERRQRLERLLIADLRHQLERRGLSAKFDLQAYERAIFDGLEDEELCDMKTLLARVASAVRDSRQVAHTVLKETSIEIYAHELLRWFDDAHMLQLVRDPRDNFGALAAGVSSYYSKLGQSRRETLMSLLFRARLGLMAAAALPAEFGDRYRSVRFEDLTAQPRPTVQSLCDWLGVGFDEACMRPSFLGHPTSGNSFDGIAMREISSQNVGRWRDRIEEWEAQVIEHVLGDQMEAHGYQRQFSATVSAEAAGRFYAWANDRYFFADPYTSNAPLPKDS